MYTYIYIYINTESLDGNQGHQEETHRPTHRFRRLFLDLLSMGWRGCASAMGAIKLPPSCPMHNTMKQSHVEIVMPGQNFCKILKIPMIGLDPVWWHYCYNSVKFSYTSLKFGKVMLSTMKWIPIKRWHILQNIDALVLFQSCTQLAISFLVCNIYYIFLF